MGTVTAVEKDVRGYVWIATAEGLHRFDGKQFKIFKHIDGNDQSLSDSYITSLLSVGRKLYIGNNIGAIDVLDVDDYSIATLSIIKEDPTFDYPISTLAFFQSKLVIGTLGGGLWSLDPKEQVFRRFQEGVSAQLTMVTDLHVMENDFYVSSGNAVYRCNWKKCEEWFQLPQPVSCLFVNDQSCMAGTSNGLYKWDRANSEVVRVPLPPRKRRINVISDVLIHRGELWVATHGGLLRFHDNEQELYLNNPNRPFSLVNNKINVLFSDYEDILWIGTISGLSRYAYKLKKFSLIQYLDFEDKSYNSNIYNVYIDRTGHVWLGTLTSGMVEMDQNHRIIQVIPVISDGRVETRSVRSIYEDSKGNFWVGTRDEGVFLYHRASNSFTQVAAKGPGQLTNTVVRSIFEDSQGHIWVGTADGINLYLPEEDAFVNYKADLKSPANNTTHQITEDRKTGNLVIATFRGGLQIFNPRSKRFVSFKHHSEDSNSISNNNVMSLEWLNEDTLLIGTYGGGLNIFNLRDKKFTHITEKNGLVNNAVYGILYQGSGVCWLSTNDGLVQFDIYGNKFYNFKPVHYLQSTEFNEGAFAKSKRGYFYFGGVSGLNYFKPDQIQYDTTAPALMITGMRGDFKSQNASKVELNFLNSRLEIDFMALFYVNPEGVRYKYKMVNYDQNWVEPTLGNTAVYPRLSPGKYEFQVIAQDEFGQWVSEPLVLQVRVEPPFWQKGWFILLLVAGVLAIIYGIFRYRTQEIEKEYKHQLVDSELRALRSQMNPHFIFNSLNSIQYFILKKQPQEAYTYLSKFASLMRKILQNSRLKYISISDETEWLELYLEMEKLRMDNNLDFVIDTGNIEDVENTHIPTMLIQPYVENSIIHGLLSKENDRRIRIDFNKRDDHIVCVVEDNGIGREASKALNEKRVRKHDSAGMALTKTRLKILSEGKGDFDVQIEDLTDAKGPSGTKVTIFIPLIDKPNEPDQSNSR